MRVYAIVNSKGGVAKSTNAAHLLAALNRRYPGEVLAVDIDEQATLSSYVEAFVEDGAVPGGDVFRVLTGEATLESSVLKTSIGDLLRASPLIPELQLRFPRDPKMLTRLRRSLEKSHYRAVVIDTPGRLNIEMLIAVASADVIIFPVIPSDYSVETLGSVREAIQRCYEDEDRKPRLVVLPSAFGTRQNHRSMLDEIQSIPGAKILTAIPLDENVKIRTEARLPLDPKSKPHAAFDALAAEVSAL